jgi:hypothetical protein
MYQLHFFLEDSQTIREGRRNPNVVNGNTLFAIDESKNNIVIDIEENSTRNRQWKSDLVGEEKKLNLNEPQEQEF